MYCPRCGTDNRESAQFCEKCGFNLPVAAAAPSPGGYSAPEPAAYPAPYAQPAPSQQLYQQPYPQAVPPPVNPAMRMPGQVTMDPGGRRYAEGKNPAVALILSLFITGVGQLYNGDIKKCFLIVGGLGGGHPACADDRRHGWFSGAGCVDLVDGRCLQRRQQEVSPLVTHGADQAGRPSAAGL